MRLTTLFALAVLALIIPGCARDERRPAAPADRDRSFTRPPADTSKPVSVTGVDWVLTRLGNEAALPDKPYKARPWFHLDPSDKRRVTGNTSVNTISGTYELSGGALQFGPMTSTRRAGDPVLMRQEHGFLNALEKTATAEVNGRTLTLRDAGRSTLATFEALDVAP